MKRHAQHRKQEEHQAPAESTQERSTENARFRPPDSAVVNRHRFHAKVDRDRRGGIDPTKNKVHLPNTAMATLMIKSGTAIDSNLG
jgi:hypothetical protein